MITNAKDNGMMSAAGLPDVSEGVLSFLQSVNVVFTQTTMINGYSQDVKKSVRAMASVQPMDEKLAIRKEGERSWRWSVVHITPDPGLNTDDMFEIQGVGYRIMTKMNWSQHGYVELHVIEQYRKQQ